MAGRPPGTASRLTSGFNRPMTKGANISNQNMLLNPTRADDRPMTRGGLGGFQPSTAGFNRQVQDKTYFLGLIRSKIGEINSEMIRMNKDITNINNDNSNYLSYGRKAEELNQQIEELRGELADYNMVLDRLNTSSLSDVRSDYTNLKLHNDQETKALDMIFIEKGKKEEVVKRHEKEILEEKKRREKILSSMSGPIRNRYEKCKIESDKLQEKMDISQKELEEYKNRMDSLKQKIGFSGFKQEALNLFEQLHNAELKRDELLEETSNVLTPAEEREKLLKQIKDNNQEISSMEKHLSEIKDVIESIRAELEEKPTQQEDNTSTEEQKEISQKYKELRKREIQMDEFLANYEDNKHAEIDQLYNTRKSIVNYLELISKSVEKMNRESGVGDRRGARDTEVTIADLKKVEELEKKVTNEYEKLVEKKKKMDQELVMFVDLEGLKRRSEARKQQLMVEKQNLSKYKDNMKYELQTLQAQFETIQAQLLDQETHNQLSNLEKKLQSIEQSNFGLKEKISSASAESDYEAIKNQVLSLVSEYNKWLHKQMLNPSYNY
ncbi:intraflagellar transport 74 -like protein [Brachionus plicatilis]|uniref:Intraflagellar transport 74-like protein n=1 Tax=Brachionus plicatilis TaxID=10195 RepID=A0A3M7QN90_BRAPC|nr:intraflagellar transport 74 -like protein [Brachionus plicatilis]